MGNRYMKPDQSINDLCRKQSQKNHLYHKRSCRSTEIISNKTNTNRSQPFKFISKSYRKKKTPIPSRPTTTDRVLINGQRFVYSKDSIFISNSYQDLNENPKDLGFAIILDRHNHQDSIEVARDKYCYTVSTSTPKIRRFNAMREFEKLYQRNINGYGSEISSISKTSFDFEEINLNKCKTNKEPSIFKENESKIDGTDDNVSSFKQFPENGNTIMKTKNEIRYKSNNQFTKLCRKMSFDIKMMAIPDANYRFRPSFLNVMVIGDKGIGKTTLIYSLLQLPENNQVDNKLTDSVVHIYTASMGEDDYKMLISVADTPGLDSVAQGQTSFQYIEEYILLARLQPSTAIHCCIYCLSPFNKRLRDCDILAIGKLQTHVNIIPVIVKVDCLSVEELQALKMSIKESLRKNVSIYQLPRCEVTVDQEFKIVNNEIRKILPFSVIGSMDKIETENGIVRGRKYPWGSINIDDPTHCDLYWLKKFLFESHCGDLVFHSRKLQNRFP